MLRDGETTTKIKIVFLRGGVGGWDREENRPKNAVLFVGNAMAILF